MTPLDCSIPDEIRAHAVYANRHGRKRKILTLTVLGVAGLLAGLLAGCSSGLSATPSASASATTIYANVAGNWKFSSSAASARPMSAVAGALAVNGASVTGTLHPMAGSCAAAGSFSVAGSIDTNHLLTLASNAYPGGHFTLSGTVAADGRSLSSPTYMVANGACAFPAVATGPVTPKDAGSVTAQQFQPVTGNYRGTFTDGSGVTMPLSATLSQPSTPDANGVYHLTGYATFENNPCLNTPVVTDSTVTGDVISATYTDPNTHNTVTGSGTFSADATALTITDWVLSGSCGSDQGTGSLTRN